MKALSTLRSAIDQSSFGIIALVLLSPVIFPHLAHAADAQTLGQQAQIFEIKVADTSLLNQTPNQNNTQGSLTIDTITQSDPLVANLDAYLTSKGSPLAGNAAQIVTYPHWKRALAISVVESNMCIHTPMVHTPKGWMQSYNCSGIVGTYHYHIYTSYMDWFAGMNSLLDQPDYVSRPIEKFLGYYVQPGSPSWLYGSRKTEAELADMENQADAQRRDLAQTQANTEVALNTFQ